MTDERDPQPHAEHHSPLLRDDATEPPPIPDGRATTARAAIVVVLGALLACVLLVGDSLRATAEDMPAGAPRDVMVAVAKPAGAVARALPFAAAADAVVDWFTPDDATPVTPSNGVRPAAVASTRDDATITADDFDRRTVQTDGAPPTLTRVLVTGDSMAQPLDVQLARLLAPRGVQVTRDARLGSAISKDQPINWLDVAPQQIAEHPAQVVVMLLGANEGFPLLDAAHRSVACCTAAWAAAYAKRVRRIADAWLAGGAEQVLWLTLPAPQDVRRQPISRAVNGAARVALRGLGTRATVLATDELLTPNGRFRAAMAVGGRDRVVRAPDGIHLNDDGAAFVAQAVERQLVALYTFGR